MEGNKRYYWLKFKEDFFTSKRIKKLRKISADCVIIYLKMQLKALKTNGYLEITGIEDSIADEIALDIDEDSDKVQLTLSFLQACGLLEINTDMIFLPYVQESTGSETASAQRVREHRANKKLLQCNTDVTEVKRKCSVEKEIEIDIDIDKKKSISTNVDIPKENEFSFESHSNKDNLDYYFKTHSEYDRLKPELRQVIFDWMEYKDQRKPKKNNHYTEKGMDKFVRMIVNYATQYGTTLVIEQINNAMANTWQGTNLKMLEVDNGRYKG